MKKINIVVKKTGCRKTEIIDEKGDIIYLNVKGKPKGGEANLEIVKFFSKEYGGFAKIEAGFNSKKKVVAIE